MYTRDELIRRRATLSEANLALLRQRIQSEVTPEILKISIPRRPQDCAVPLSFAQQRLWFLQQFAPESSAYNEMIGLRLQGNLNYKALYQTIKTITERHETLRTLFPLVGGEAIQQIHTIEDISITIPLIDLQAVSQLTREQVAYNLAELEVQRPFHLMTQLPWRIHLLQLEPDLHILLIIMHHIVTDAWSLELFVKELIVHYQTHSKRGQPQGVAPTSLPIQYADYACWQHQWLESEEFSRQIKYWQQQLSGIPPLLELPFDRPRPPVLTYHGRRRRWSIPEPLRHALHLLGREEGATLFMVLLAAFNVLLCRYTDQDDMVVGSPVAGRTRPELEPLLGCFVNTLVFRTNLANNPDFRSVIQQVRHVALEAYEHQDVPFEKLVEILQPERSTGHNPLFQVMYVLQNVPHTYDMPSEFSVAPFEIEVNTTRFDLALILQETTQVLGGYVEYNTDLFDASTIERLLKHYELLLESVVVNPTQRISDIPLLSQEERFLLHSWNEEKGEPVGAELALALPASTLSTPTPSGQPVAPRFIVGVAPTEDRLYSGHFLDDFLAQITRTPDTIAVSDQNEQLSYEQLHTCSNLLAAHLLTHGIQPEEVIGLYTHRSVLWAVSMLAIFKAGAVYLPLDLHYPPARLHAILQQSRCRLLLTTCSQQARFSSSLPENAPEILCIDTLLTTGLPDTANKAAIRDRRLLAYLIFTSGSTGQPKGVMLEHGGMYNHLHAKRLALQLNQQDRIAQTASHCFDISLWQLLSGWLVGAQVRIYSDWLVADPHAFLQQIEQDGISILEGVPSWLDTLLEAGSSNPSAFPLTRLRWLIATGEALSVDLCRRWLQRYPQIPLLNAYGPTECSDDVTHQVIAKLPEAGKWGATVPIGTALPNVRLYVLDRQGNPQPIGIWGQLYIGGIGVGRGYVGLPARTADFFVPDPWSPHPGQRLYRTGDIARYRADGSLEFQGRLDQQVKLRGYRIELGEIEAALNRHTAIRNSAVILREDLSSSKRLVAYITLLSEHHASSEELWTFLQQRLPDYMLPTTFVYLEELPLLTNGKIDRRALPMPDSNRPTLEVEFVAARDPIAEILVGTWSRALGIEQIGIHDNFFSLGGHSLLVPQLASGIQSAFGLELPWPTFFSSPTIAEQAREIKQALQKDHSRAVPPLVPVARTREMPLSFTQERQWFLDQLNQGQHLYNVFGAVSLSGPFQVAALERSLQEVVRRHEILRTTFKMKQDGSLIQVIAPTLALSPLIIDVQQLSDLERELAMLRLLDQEKQWSFDLARGPLLRLTLVRLAEDEHILALTGHLIIFDGWATEIFLRELALLYSAFVNGSPSPLAELPIQYADYACWQRALLQEQTLKHLLDYWRERLVNLPMLTLPTDRPRPARPTFQAAIWPINVPAQLTAQLKALSQREGATLYITLLAAYQAVLARYSGQNDIVVGSPIANRSTTELEGLIGSFINTLVLRTDTSGNPTFRDLLGRVRHSALAAYAHQDLPFEKLLAELHPERDMSRNPLFQALFAFQNIPQLQVSLPGIRAEFLSDESETTVFDLDLTMWESADGLAGGLKYSTDLFDSPFISRIKDDFLALLELVVTDPEQHIADMVLSPLNEQRKLLVEWNATDAAYNREICIHQLFEEQVLQRPDAVAAVFMEQTLTYNQLNRQANRLAHHLRSLGIGPGSMVAIFMQRSLEIIPALLAILKAGASYVPLETSFPNTRIQWILKALKINAIITQSGLVSVIQQLEDIPDLTDIICPEIDALPLLENTLPSQMQLWTRADLAPHSAEKLPTVITANALAYIIFTSGSTGTPKGVMIRHRPVINLIEWVNRTFHIHPADRVLFVTSLCFDLSVYDIFGLLAAGGSIQIVPSSDLGDPERLLELLESEPVTFWDSAPAALQQLVPFFPEKQASERQSHLRLVFLSGDWIPVKQPDQIRAAFPAAQVVSLGGATEATVWSNFFRIGEVAPQWVSIPYGRPIQNAQYYILNRELRPCPIGVPGDLYISGECLADGYVGAPELTAQKFIPNPFVGTSLWTLTNSVGNPRGDGIDDVRFSVVADRTSDQSDAIKHVATGEYDHDHLLNCISASASDLSPTPASCQPGARLYKTGDVARFWADGTMEFLGRSDTQVKIRGFRVEMGEIEATLSRHNGVQVAIVEARRDSSGEKRLIAYVVSRKEQALTTGELRTYLQHYLPEYMIPSVFVFLDQLPVTANGKIDRHKLPDVDEHIATEQADTYVAPTTPTEEKMATIWANVLKLPRVGIYDNFFEIGGHSLLAVQLIAQVRTAWQVQLPLRELFEFATVAGLAERVEEILAL